MRALLPLLLVPLASCVRSDERRAAAEVQPVVETSGGPSAPSVEDRRAITRARFEIGRHGGAAHVAVECPHCSDPIQGVVPDEALLDGPADVWE